MKALKTGQSALLLIPLDLTMSHPSSPYTLDEFSPPPRSSYGAGRSRSQVAEVPFAFAAFISNSL